MIKASELSDEQLLSYLHYWEEPHALQLFSLKEGGVGVGPSEGSGYGEGKTFRDALISLGCNIVKKYPNHWLTSQIDWNS